MRLLVVAPYPPTPPFAGGRKRIFEELQFLSRRHEVDLACLTYSDADDYWLSRMRSINVVTARRPAFRECSSYAKPVATFWSCELRDEIGQLIRKRNYDWILAEHCYAARYLENVSIPKAVVEHNIEYRIFEQLAEFSGNLEKVFFLAGKPAQMFSDAKKEVASLKHFEREVWSRMNLCIAVSQNERKIMAEVVDDQRLHVVPNCPSVSIRTEPLAVGPLSLFFIGALNYLPNVDAVVQLIDGILPIIRQGHPDVKVIVAGRDPEPQLVRFCNDAKIQIVPNPVSFETLISSNSVMVCPLRFGAGTKIKILDALAAGTPIVASNSAVEGLGVTAGKEVLLGSSPETFGQAISELLSSQSLRMSLVRAGQEFVRSRKLTWPAVFATFQRLLEDSRR